MSTENSTANGQDGGSAARSEITTGSGLLQKISIVGGMTLISRILGLLRDQINDKQAAQ